MKIGRVGILSVVERLPNSKYLCKCDCGKERIVSVGHFNTGDIKSCGCHHWHGHGGVKKSREYVSYYNMIARCHKPQNKRFKDYGGVGIEVCARWRNSFQYFLDDMGLCPEGCQIDRINNTGNYEPDNCRWTTPKENMANRNNTKIWSVHGKEFFSAKEAGQQFGVCSATIIAWCAGRTAAGRYYPPKAGCSVVLAAIVRTHARLRAKGIVV